MKLLSEKEIKAQYKKGTRSVKKRIKKAGSRVKINTYLELAEFLAHDSWRCDYYKECHCGLNDTTDKLGLPRVPYEGKFK
jgi:hypothetical protein